MRRAERYAEHDRWRNCDCVGCGPVLVPRTRRRDTAASAGHIARLSGRLCTSGGRFMVALYGDHKGFSLKRMRWI